MTEDSSRLDNNASKQAQATIISTGSRRMRVDGKMEQEWVKIQYGENGKEASRTRFWQTV